MKETNIKNLCCSLIIKYFRAAHKSLLLFRAAHRNKQKYFDAFALLWDVTKSTNCPGRAGFAKARYMKSFSQSKAQIVQCGYPVTALSRLPKDMSAQLRAMSEKLPQSKILELMLPHGI
jgi:hypothetical protein